MSIPHLQISHICHRQMSIPHLHLWRGGSRQAGGEVKALKCEVKALKCEVKALKCEVREKTIA